jgi:hypothetical protein
MENEALSRYRKVVQVGYRVPAPGMPGRSWSE